MQAEEFKTRFMLQQIQQPHRFPANGRERQAGVLLALQPTDAGLSVLLTQRTAHLAAHPNQISFPGGKFDQTDANLTVTALREAWEEICLPKQQVDVLGQLPAINTLTGFIITPVVGLIPATFRPQAAPGEVAQCLHVPFNFLLQPQHRLFQSFSRRGHQRNICFIPWQDRLIWGATAAIIDSLCRQLS
ncbi:coenzyme A pyrophosphatase [Shewanella sp. NFH-SH190041]|uniref:CoA pyrophosphatase n=1 Tax=Shewanella sp. NFH-SH190041 TaxID=2950245 RepID=UPI0021C47B35|nr:CoA pyrophosphatase [Shewanella sp. NFH-SH190041]BDM64497.1 coenzyme A pyrophosphatase [Shewanella sp. NFH-SH190041]